MVCNCYTIGLDCNSVSCWA